MSPSESTIHQEVYKHFVDVGCCRTCCLRILGNRDKSSYKSVDESLKELGVQNDGGANEKDEDSHSNKLVKPNPCVGCLGLLQKPYSDSLINEIIRGANISEYDAKTFNVSMNLPSCYLLRSEALLVELRKHFPAFYEKNFDGQALLSLKDAFKACFGHQLGDTLSLTLDLSSGFVIDVEFRYDDDQEECKPLCSLRPDIFTRHYVRKNGYTKNRIESILDTLDCDEFSKTFQVPPLIPSQVIKIVKVTLARESTNVAGRYNKYCRDLPQTPWLLNGERKMESSVEELISGPIVALLRGTSSKFASSGREDVDVRSLGRGRPFNVEVLMPKVAALQFDQLRALEKEITEKSEGKLKVRDLQIVARESLVTLKQGEEEKTKEYTALCFCPDGIPDTLEGAVARAPLVLDQSTPIRVLHRRPVAVRQKEILEMSVTRLEGDARKFILNLKTQAGTYIKEFIHGDFGRTKPSFGDLLGGAKVDILALDVTDIALDWPPRVSCDDVKSNGKH
uniref:tRNA pseudouridine(55) synthase n=1 Tax=Lygus hesperus TaxID=30085 RepID=A0A0A9XA35_LYGHE